MFINLIYPIYTRSIALLTWPRGMLHNANVLDRTNNNMIVIFRDLLVVVQQKYQVCPEGGAIGKSTGS